MDSDLRGMIASRVRVSPEKSVRGEAHAGGISAPGLYPMPGPVFYPDLSGEAQAGVRDYRRKMWLAVCAVSAGGESAGHAAPGHPGAETRGVAPARSRTWRAAAGAARALGAAMPVGPGYYRTTTTSSGKKLRLHFTQGGTVNEAKNLATGATHTPAEFQAERKRRGTRLKRAMLGPSSHTSDAMS